MQALLTVLRLAKTLAMDDYLAQRPDGTWRLARDAGWLGACYQATFNVLEIVQQVLHDLSSTTGESAGVWAELEPDWGHLHFGSDLAPE